MNTPIITIPIEEAREQLRAYREMQMRWLTVDEEQQTLIAGYRALAKGYRLLTLTACFEHAGLDRNGRPKLAIAPADHRHCVCLVERDRVSFRSDRTRVDRMWEDPTISIPYATGRYASTTGYTAVPLVPARCMPAASNPLSDYWILWEVEHWANLSEPAKSPVDPYLLWRLGPDLWAIVAEWELTPLEQAIVSGRNLSD